MKLKHCVVLYLAIMIGCSPNTLTRSSNVDGAADELQNGEKKYTVLEHLKSGQKIRLQTRNGEFLEGKFQVLDGATVVLVVAETQSQVQLGDIAAVWVRRGSAATGAKIGAIGFGILGSIGGLALHGLCQAFDESEDPQGCPEFIAAGVIGGAAAGAILGAGIGAASRSWQRLYP